MLFLKPSVLQFKENHYVILQKISCMIYYQFWITYINIYIYTGFSRWINERHRWHRGIFAVVRHVSFAGQNILVNWQHVLCSRRTTLREYAIIDNKTSFSGIKNDSKTERICLENIFLEICVSIFLYAGNNKFNLIWKTWTFIN